MIESELNKVIAERILYELGKNDYSETKLFTEQPVEVKFDRKKTIRETRRVKQANTQFEKKNRETLENN